MKALACVVCRAPYGRPCTCPPPDAPLKIDMPAGPIADADLNRAKNKSSYLLLEAMYLELERRASTGELQTTLKKDRLSQLVWKLTKLLGSLKPAAVIVPVPLPERMRPELMDKHSAMRVTPVSRIRTQRKMSRRLRTQPAKPADDSEKKS